MQHYLLAISKYFIENENLETETGFVGGGCWRMNKHNNYHYQLRLPGKVADNEVG